MSLKICCFASGSKGNCIFVRSDRTKVLIDAGISATRIIDMLGELGETPDNINLLVTHNHNDHIGGIANLCKKIVPTVYIQDEGYYGLLRKSGGYRNINVYDGDFFIGDITVSPFKVSHDVPCVGYSLYSSHAKISIVTDIGVMTRSVMNSLEGSGIVLIEANHDEEMVRCNVTYTEQLKQRILSTHGHLSNRACGEAASILARSGTNTFILGHLSKENNYPELAFATVRDTLEHDGFVEGRDVRIEVALQDERSKVFEIK